MEKVESDDRLSACKGRTKRIPRPPGRGYQKQRQTALCGRGYHEEEIRVGVGVIQTNKLIASLLDSRDELLQSRFEFGLASRKLDVDRQSEKWDWTEIG